MSLSYDDIMLWTEEWLKTNSKHQGACFVSADNAYKNWRKAGKRPADWQGKLVSHYFSDNVLFKVTRKSDWKRDKALRKVEGLQI